MLCTEGNEEKTEQISVQNQFQSVHSTKLNNLFLNLYLAFTDFLVLPVSLVSAEGRFSFMKHSKVSDPIFDVSRNVKITFILVILDDLCP